jgi:hypothetical protein
MAFDKLNSVLVEDVLSQNDKTPKILDRVCGNYYLAFFNTFKK